MESAGGIILLKDSLKHKLKLGNILQGINIRKMLSDKTYYKKVFTAVLSAYVLPVLVTFAETVTFPPAAVTVSVSIEKSV